LDGVSKNFSDAKSYENPSCGSRVDYNNYQIDALIIIYS